METLDLLKQRIFKKDNTSSVKLTLNRTRKAIEEMCSEKLHDLGDVFTFEANPTSIDDVLIVIEQESLTSKFHFIQTGEYTFEVRLRNLDLG